MSNSSDKNESKEEASPRRKRLSFIQNELASALTAWNELETAAIPLSPDQEQLLKIKALISQLREKLDHF